MLSDRLDQRLLAVMLQGDLTPTVSVVGVESGFEIHVERAGKTYKLETQRRSVRTFKSPTTALKWLAEIGVDNVRFIGLKRWAGKK